MKLRSSVLCLLISLSIRGEVLQVAVASNFVATLEELAVAFEKHSSVEVQCSPGSTGRHYAQITHGAPYDLFFAADVERPRLLEEQGKIVKGSRFTYAIGKLVLWSPDPKRISDVYDLSKTDFRHLAIANPTLAPYGVAAKEVLKVFNLWDLMESRIVLGSNIAQTAQFVQSGAAEIGFVALSQIQRPGKELPGSIWHPPPHSYAPIVQQAVLLNDTPAARAFISFLTTDEAETILSSFGYGVPNVIPGGS